MHGEHLIECLEWTIYHSDAMLRSNSYLPNFSMHLVHSNVSTRETVQVGITLKILTWTSMYLQNIIRPSTIRILSSLKNSWRSITDTYSPHLERGISHQLVISGSRRNLKSSNYSQLSMQMLKLLKSGLSKNWVEP